jgi:hypothetical protein
MRNGAGWIVIGAAVGTFLWCVGAVGQQADAPQPSDAEWYRHIDTSEPRLPDRPFRRENISDDEVREVQQAALAIYPNSIVVISGVVEGCTCEEGSHCTAEVGLVLNRGNQTRTLVLSKISGHWKVGAVQAWWLQYNAHQASNPGYGFRPDQVAWRAESQRLLESFPACPVPAEYWSLLRAGVDGRGTYIDRLSLKVDGTIRHVNYKKVHYSLKQKPIRGFTVPKFSIELVAFDCRDFRMRTDENTVYFDDGTARKMSVTAPVLWDPVRPNTVPGEDLNLVCGWDMMK